MALALSLLHEIPVRLEYLLPDSVPYTSSLLMLADPSRQMLPNFIELGLPAFSANSLAYRPAWMWMNQGSFHFPEKFCFFLCGIVQ
jgi:hypothetical protein